MGTRVLPEFRYVEFGSAADLPASHRFIEIGDGSRTLFVQDGHHRGGRLYAELLSELNARFADIDGLSGDFTIYQQMTPMRFAFECLTSAPPDVRRIVSCGFDVDCTDFTYDFNENEFFRPARTAPYEYGGVYSRSIVLLMLARSFRERASDNIQDALVLIKNPDLFHLLLVGCMLDDYLLSAQSTDTVGFNGHINASLYFATALSSLYQDATDPDLLSSLYRYGNETFGLNTDFLADILESVGIEREVAVLRIIQGGDSTRIDVVENLETSQHEVSRDLNVNQNCTAVEGVDGAGKDVILDIYPGTRISISDPGNQIVMGLCHFAGGDFPARNDKLRATFDLAIVAGDQAAITKCLYDLRRLLAEVVEELNDTEFFKRPFLTNRSWWSGAVYSESTEDFASQLACESSDPLSLKQARTIFVDTPLSICISRRAGSGDPFDSADLRTYMRRLFRYNLIARLIYPETTEILKVLALRGSHADVTAPFTHIERMHGLALQQ